MIRFEFSALDAAIIESRFRQLETKVRRKILQKAASAAAKVNLEALRQEVVPEVSRTLKKSWRTKVRVYPTSGRAWAAAGPKSERKEVDQYEYYRLWLISRGVTKEAAGRRVDKKRRLNAAHYAHLAGTGRKGMSVPNVRKRMARRTFEIIGEVFRTEVFAQ